MSKSILSNWHIALISLATSVALFMTGQFGWVLSVAIGTGLFVALRFQNRQND